MIPTTLTTLLHVTSTSASRTPSSTPVRVQILERGPGWLDYVLAFGTLAAVIFAAVAAMAAWRSTKATVALVELEKDRDERATDAAIRHQVKRVVVSLGFEFFEGATEYLITLTNASPDPIRFCRLKLAQGDVVVGPQLIRSTLAPYTGFSWTITLPNSDDTVSAVARVVDVEGRGWVIDQSGHCEVDDDLNRWLAETVAWIDRLEQLEVEERNEEAGYTTGPFPIGQA